MAWLTLPDPIFSDIMLMVGLESIESLHRCRQVCRTWNEKILTYIWESEMNKNKMKRSIVLKWGTKWDEVFPSNELISHAKWLGNDSLLSSFIANFQPL